MLNVVNLIGRLTKEIELRKTNSGKSVTQFTLAVNRNTKEDRADFPSVVVWNQGAEYLSKYSTKGDLVSVEGRLQTRSYDGDHGKQYVTEVVADRVQLLSFKKQEKVEPTRNDFEPKQYDTYQTNRTNYQPTLNGNDSFAESDMGGSYEGDQSLGFNSDDLPFY